MQVIELINAEYPQNSYTMFCLFRLNLKLLINEHCELFRGQ